MGWDKVRQLIIDDISRLGIGAKLDSDARFAERAGCSVPTVKRAMADLARRGFIIRRRGRRTISSDKTTVVSGTDFSFSRSAKGSHGQSLISKLIEKSRRLPNLTPESEFEVRAQRGLGLKRNQPFFVITRRRTLDGRHRVIHRSYLNPGHYPAAFLASHDFENESLLEILEAYGLRVHSRETRIRAGFPTPEECDLLKITNEPVLNVEQSSYAVSSTTGNLVIAEYLHATYSQWEYVISDRR
jgi:GntR family transcriptional regulator